MAKKKDELLDNLEEEIDTDSLMDDDSSGSSDEAIDVDNLMGDDLGDDMESMAPLSDKVFMDFSDFEAGIEDITFDTDGFINMAIYGPQGTGKTTFAASCPSTILLDVNEKGTNVLIGSNVRKRKTNTFEMFQKAYWYLESGKHPYRTVVIDTMTMLESLILDYLMNRGSEMDASKDKEMPKINDYGSRSLLMQRWILAFRNLNMNTIFLVQERKSKEDDIQSDEPSVFPDLSPKAGIYLNAAVDIVGRTYTKEKTIKVGDSKDVVDQYYMRLKGNSIYKAKCRVPIGAYCPRVIKDPTFDKIKTIYMGKAKDPKGGK